MNRHSIARMTAALALGAACALPVMAQDTSGTASGGTAAGSQSSAQMAQTQPSDSSSTTRSMGAGPEDMGTQRDEHRDMGWIGLLGLAGLLGLRRRQHHDDRGDYNRTTRTTTAR